jgi:hypothetical protein
MDSYARARPWSGIPWHSESEQREARSPVMSYVFTHTCVLCAPLCLGGTLTPQKYAMSNARLERDAEFLDGEAATSAPASRKKRCEREGHSLCNGIVLSLMTRSW